MIYVMKCIADFSHMVYLGFDSRGWHSVNSGHCKKGVINMTKRELQRLENQLVEEAWEKAKKVWHSIPDYFDEYERIDYCKAWTYKSNGYTFLVSYNTLVAFIDDNDNMYDVLRLVYGYTATSAKHISKFRNKFRHVSEHTWREV